MYDYLENDLQIGTDKKTILSEWFLTHYQNIRPRDIYRWLWEGEFGTLQVEAQLNLDRLTEDIRLARIHGRRHDRVWEPLGLAMVLVKINLIPYADTGCPLKRLLSLEAKVQNVHPNPMRLKLDWTFMKTQLNPDRSISASDMTEFENNIPFHLVPEVGYSEAFLDQFGPGYRIVPRKLFFHYFPEYEMEEEAMFASGSVKTKAK